MPKVKDSTHRSHYEVLGVPPNCTLAQVKRAYRQIQMKHHPDKTGTLPEKERQESEDLSKAANTAYEILGNEQKRSEYDKKHAQPIVTYFHPYEYHSSSGYQGYSPSRGYNGPDFPNNAYSFSASSYKNSPTFSPDSIYSNTFTLERDGWRMGMELSKRFKCSVWGPNHVWTTGDSILFFIQLEEIANGTKPTQNDVRVAVIKSPEQRRVTKVESYFKHRMTEREPTTVLWIKLSAPKTAQRNFLSWDWAFDVETSHCIPPASVVAYVTSMIFEYDSHDSQTPHPKYRILEDQDFPVKSNIQLGEMGNDAYVTVEYGRNNKMQRRAAFGYVYPDGKQDEATNSQFKREKRLGQKENGMGRGRCLSWRGPESKWRYRRPIWKEGGPGWGGGGRPWMGGEKSGWWNESVDG